MRADVVRKKDVVFDRDVARQSNFVSEDVVIAHDAIMRDVNANHQEVARAYAGRFAFTSRAVYGHELAYQIIIADDEAGRLAPELQVLRRAAEDSVLTDAVAASKGRVALDDRVGVYLAASANRHVIFDNDIRAYANIICYL
jgi:hypothetical protein